jgi:hypothetical protein
MYHTGTEWHKDVGSISGVTGCRAVVRCIRVIHSTRTTFVESRTFLSGDDGPQTVSLPYVSSFCHALSLSLSLSRTQLDRYCALLGALRSNFQTGPRRHGLGTVAVQYCTCVSNTVWVPSQSSILRVNQTRSGYRRSPVLYGWIKHGLGTVAVQYCTCESNTVWVASQSSIVCVNQTRSGWRRSPSTLCVNQTRSGYRRSPSTLCVNQTRSGYRRSPVLLCVNQTRSAYSLSPVLCECFKHGLSTVAVQYRVSVSNTLYLQS